jgi:4-amino-4-deoxy-L-arabinose transferase-like glycosyltransferase
MNGQDARAITYARGVPKSLLPSWSLLTLELVVILALAAVVRLYYIRQPFVDAFSWRQSSTAMMAENFYRGNWNIFYPEVRWTGPGPSYQGREFQTMSYIAALAYVALGQHDWIGRFVSLLFGLLGIFSLYQLVRSLWGERRAIITAVVMAVLPGSVFIERSFLPDSAMVALVTTGFWLLVRYLQTGKSGWLIASGVIGAWGFCSKITGLILCLPMAYAALAILNQKRRLTGNRVAALALFALLAFTPVAAYYLWARHLALSYPPYHFAGDGNWIWNDGLRSWLRQDYFLPGLAHHLKGWVWTIPSIGLIIIGLISGARPGKSDVTSADGIAEDGMAQAPWLFHWWAVACVIYYLIGAKELVNNPWNLHLFNPAAAALAASAIYFLSSLAARAVAPLASILVTTALIGAVYLSGQSGLRYMYNDYASDGYKLGLALRQATAPEDLVITMTSDLGDPVAIYYSSRRGWVFPPAQPGVAWSQLPEDDTESIRLLEQLRASGAGWLAITEKRKIDLENHHTIFLEYINRTWGLSYTSTEGAIYRMLSPGNNSR